MKKLIFTTLVLCAPQMHAMQMGAPSASQSTKKTAPKNSCLQIAKICCIGCCVGYCTVLAATKITQDIIQQHNDELKAICNDPVYLDLQATLDEFGRINEQMQSGSYFERELSKRIIHNLNEPENNLKQELQDLTVIRDKCLHESENNKKNQ